GLLAAAIVRGMTSSPTPMEKDPNVRRKKSFHEILFKKKNKGNSTPEPSTVQAYCNDYYHPSNYHENGKRLDSELLDSITSSSVTLASISATASSPGMRDERIYNNG